MATLVLRELQVAPALPLIDQLQELRVPKELPCVENGDEKQGDEEVSRSTFIQPTLGSSGDDQEDGFVDSQSADIYTSRVSLKDDQTSIRSDVTSVGHSHVSGNDLLPLHTGDVLAQRFNRRWKGKSSSSENQYRQQPLDYTQSRVTQRQADDLDKASIRSILTLVSPFAPSNRHAALPTRRELADIQGVLDSMQSAMSIRSHAVRLESAIKKALDAGMSTETGFRWRGIRHECYDQGTPLLLIITAMGRFARGISPLAELLLLRGANADGPDDHWRRPLAKAAKWTPELVPLLLKYGANPNLQKGDKTPPLFRAATSEKMDKKLLSTLLEGGANIDCADGFGRNILHYFFIEAAYKANNVENARFLIQKGADLDHKDCLELTPYELGIKANPSQRYRGAGLNPWRGQGGYHAILSMMKPVLDRTER